MKWLLPLLLAAMSGLSLPGAVAQDDAETPCEERPVLVELFTSQGCGLCPEANRYLGELDQRENVFVLAYAVSYWDMYGWTDTYARPEYVQRQRTYLPRLDVPRLYTPHFVVDGVTDAPGWERDAVALAVGERLTAMPDSPVITIADGPFGSFQVTLDGNAPEEELDVWLVAYSPGWATVEVRAGENDGLDMLHYNMVKSMTYLGNWAGGPATFTGESFRRYGTVAIVQGANGGPVYGYARVAPSEMATR
ncbi:DUF1223 domain-containing protein [Maricaulis sp.]|uniref:DUF1223 domain-containing protein n=2 Tax=Maricaulis TaxID=74317 RepID=UPI00262C81F3|nr:DUF1223 domain-containing protein [Maricaulis sp.]MDF1767798.1 DUF1223 domain-containing protein [Maricaulis sp.]